MVDGPLNFQRTVARPQGYNWATARALAMRAIADGLYPEVIGWHTTVSDQFILAAHGGGVLAGGIASPTVMEFPITYDGVYVEQFPIGTYFAVPVNRVYQKGPSQPNPQPVPNGYKAMVTKVSVEVGWVTDLVNPPWDPGDYTRWFWKRKHPEDVGYSNVPGAIGRPAQSRTLYGTNAIAGVPNATYNQLYIYPQAALPPIFLEPGDLSILRVENYTSNTQQQVALSISASGVMWPIGLEAPGR